MKKVLGIFGWIIIIVLQGITGYVMGFLLGGSSSFPPVGVTPFPLVWWLGITIGIFMAGAIALLVRKQNRPGKYLKRLIFTAIGAFIPVFTTKALGFLHFQPSTPFNVMYIFINILISLNILLAIMLALMGFYFPGWFDNKIHNK